MDAAKAPLTEIKIALITVSISRRAVVAFAAVDTLAGYPVMITSRSTDGGDREVNDTVAHET